MLLVLDTNILARAARGGMGLAATLVREAVNPPNVLVLSPFLVLELSQVLRYPRMLAIHGLDDAGIDAFVQTVQSFGLMTAPTSASLTAVVANDPKDDPIIATAIDGLAEVICTLDRHFRQAAVISYCAQHGIRILSDVELLNELRTQMP